MGCTTAWLAESSSDGSSGPRCRSSSEAIHAAGGAEWCRCADCVALAPSVWLAGWECDKSWRAEQEVVEGWLSARVSGRRGLAARTGQVRIDRRFAMAWMLWRRWAPAVGVAACVLGPGVTGASAQVTATTSFASPGSYSFVVPAGVSSITVTAVGAVGGSNWPRRAARPPRQARSVREDRASHL